MMPLTRWPLITKKLKHLVLLVINVYNVNLPEKKEKKITQFTPIETNQPLFVKGQRTIRTMCDKGVHSKCSLTFDLALCSI